MKKQETAFEAFFVFFSLGAPDQWRSLRSCEVLHNANVLHNVFMNTTVMYLYLFMCKHSFQFKEYFLSCFDRSSF